MNDLQLGLIALGGAAVGGVFAFNKWQEWRHRKLAERMLDRSHADVLLDAATEAGERPAPAAFVAPWQGDATDGQGEQPVCAERTAYLDSGQPESPERSGAPGVAVPPPDIGGAVALLERREPSLSFPDAAVDTADAGPPLLVDEAVPPAIQPSSPPLSSRVAEPAPAPLAATVDGEGVPAIIVAAAIDHVARFELAEPVAGSDLLAVAGETLAGIGKAVGWAGFNERSGLWERVEAAGSYRRLRAGLQLADRRGPLGEADLLVFEGAMRDLADSLLTAVDLPPHDAALAKALALDAFCADVDIQIGLNLESRGTRFPGTKIRALAEAAGMVLDACGRFVRCDDDGCVLYTLANREAEPFASDTMKTLGTHRLCFSLDVPRVAHGDRVFAQMLDLARRMADTLDGALVDDMRRPLSEAQLEPFRRQIAQYQAQLAARGFPAGGALAQRLFA